MVRFAALLGSALVHLACAQLVAMERLTGLRVTEPALVSRSADLAGLSIVANFGSGPTIQLFDVLDDPCRVGRDRERKRESPIAEGRADTCFPVEAAVPAPVWQTD
jgi:hypothetical protein